MIMTETRERAQRARAAFIQLSTAADRTQILNEIADILDANAVGLFAANEQDRQAAKRSLAAPLYKRLIFNEPKLRDVIAGIRQVAAMEDPIGRIVQETELDDGLILRKVQTPIGVIAMIFESRPDAAPQIASLAIR